MYVYFCTIDRVVDGDTVDVFIDLGFDISVKKRVRLYGINAPESRTLDLEEKALGLASKAALIKKLDELQGPMKIKTHMDKTGKYGRLLGELFTPLCNVNKWMVDRGYAIEQHY